MQPDPSCRAKEAAMIDHISFKVSDFDRSARFYDQALAPLGLKRLYDDPNGPGRATGYGDQRPYFWIAEAKPVSTGLHIALLARSREEVDGFHRAALAAGGIDNGGPGFRPQYHPSYYGAFVLDPDGHNIEAVFHDPSVT
jgi:catechol 2,3-dioxygenase-like lactoylglutathione lyase family enzyme